MKGGRKPPFGYCADAPGVVFGAFFFVFLVFVFLVFFAFFSGVVFSGAATFSGAPAGGGTIGVDFSCAIPAETKTTLTSNAIIMTSAFFITFHLLSFIYIFMSGSYRYYLKLTDISIGTSGSSPIYFALIIDPDFTGIIFVIDPRESRSPFLSFFPSTASESLIQRIT